MNYTYEVEPTDMVGGILAGFGIYTIVMLAICILLIVSMYKVFKKAGRKGWEALIPIYNFIVMIQIAELPMWYIALYFIPFANIYAMFKIYIEFAHKFGKSTGFGVASVFFSFICFPILAFGDAQYQGSVSSNNGYNSNVNQINNVNNIQTSPNMGMDYNQNIGMNNVAPNQNNIMPNSSNVSELNNEMNTNLQPEVAVAPVAPVTEPAPQETTMVNPTTTESLITPTESVQSPKKFCPNCGNQVDQNDAICFMCGNQF